MADAGDAMNPLNIVREIRAARLVRDGLKDRSKFRSVEYRAKLLDALLSLSEVQDMLQGYKTYIIAALAGAVQVAVMLGYISQDIANELLKLLAAGGVATVAAKLNRAIAAR